MLLTIKKLFEELGFDPTEMVVNTPYPVTQVCKVRSIYNSVPCFKQVVNCIVKEEANAYIVETVSGLSLVCSGDHKVSHMHGDFVDFTPVKDLQNIQFWCLTEAGVEAAIVTHLARATKIYDIEVEDSHCYYSNGILSHNTYFGNPNTFTGGWALKHDISLNLEFTNRGAVLGDDKETVGYAIKIAVRKNNWSVLRATDKDEELIFYIDDGIAKTKIYTLYDRAVRFDIFQCVGRTWTWYDITGSEFYSCVGKESLKNALINKPELLEALEKQLSNEQYRNYTGNGSTFKQLDGESGSDELLTEEGDNEEYN